MPIFESLYKSKFLSTESKAFLKSINAKKVSWPISFLFLSTVTRAKIWSIQDLVALKPFCSSTKMLFCSKNNCNLVLSILEYIFATQQIIVMHLLLRGSLGSLSFLGIGFILLESHSVGLSPEIKQMLKKE